MRMFARAVAGSKLCPASKTRLTPARISVMGACRAIARVVGLIGFPGILDKQFVAEGCAQTRKHRTHVPGWPKPMRWPARGHAALSHQRIKGNKQVHVRFWESAGLRCPAPLTYLRAYDTVAEARRLIGRYLDFFNSRRPHSSLAARTPDYAYFTQLPTVAAAAA